MGIINRLSDICKDCPCPSVNAYQKVQSEGHNTIIECQNAQLCGYIEKYLRRLIEKEKNNENR